MDSQATVASSADSTPCKRSAKTRRCTSSKYHGKINIWNVENKVVENLDEFAFLLCKVYTFHFYSIPNKFEKLAQIEYLLVAMLGLWLFSRSKSCTISRQNLRYPDLLRFRQCQAKSNQVLWFFFHSLWVSHYISSSTKDQSISEYHHLTTSQLVFRCPERTWKTSMRWFQVNSFGIFGEVGEIPASAQNLTWRTVYNNGTRNQHHYFDGKWYKLYQTYINHHN